MDYSELLGYLYRSGYTRIERDDRLLDIFPLEDREKGVELWEKWATDGVYLLRVTIPYATKKLRLYGFKRSRLETMLQKNSVADLSIFEYLAEGNEAVFKLQNP